MPKRRTINKRIKPVTIGVLGGIGPESAASFYSQLISNFQHRFKPSGNTAYPHIINSIPAPELVGGQISAKILRYYVDGLNELVHSGADFLVIVCNTAHAFLPYFQQRIRVPIIDLPQAIKKRIKSVGAKSVTRLVTPTGYRLDLYRFKNIKFNELSSSEVKMLGQAIIKYNIGRQKPIQRKIVKNIFTKYAAKSGMIILGCTEISEIINKKSRNIIDPMKELIVETLNEYARRVA